MDPSFRTLRQVTIIISPIAEEQIEYFQMLMGDEVP
jgi:hypothetical protein